MTKLRVFSGVQSTGNLHLGNYLGAIKNWVAMQKEMECIFGIMNLHAITTPQDPKALRQSTREVAAAFIAAGIDPKKSIIFPQSAVSAHAELAWILGCFTPLGWLNRMTQFKEKAGKQNDLAVLGLYGYPVLMAADILGYHATHVPVGEDQKQHLELARDIAGAFNRFVGEEFFPLPEPKIMPTAARIMSLRDGTKKMSKSDESDYSRINLTDDADAIALKFRKAKSDMVEGIHYDEEKRPEVSNLIQIYAALSDQTVEAVVGSYASSNLSNFKTALTDLAVAKLSPITERMRELMRDVTELDSLLKTGSDRAAAIAEPILKATMDKIGLLSR
ncbi:MAG: tryptophan--tRNA ligase [Alphaproteobacteria bacterium]